VTQDAREVARAALAGRRAWVVGGAVRDRLLQRATTDLDLVVEDDPRGAARAVVGAAGGAAFELSDAFGAWRVVGPQRRWQIDLMALQGGSLDEDLARRDFTINAMAEPLHGGELRDPCGGVADLGARRLRMVAERAFDDDPLRTLRLVRFACELDLEPDPATVQAARARAAGLAAVAPERVFAELRRIIAAPRVLDGLALLDRVGLTPFVLPDLDRLRGIEQNRYHHLDVHGHTLEVLEQVIALEADPAPYVGAALAAPLTAFLAQPLADELTRGTALRFGALLHDAAKPETQTLHEDGSILGFPGHADLGADRSRAALTALRTSERLRAHVAALARHHLRLGYLVHEAPLSRAAIYGYLAATEPVAVDVSLLSVADRLATRGRKADEAIARHLEVARVVLPEALEFPAFRALAPLVRGDELARALGEAPGPRLGALLEAITAARFAGDVTTPGAAIALARRLG
jgi:poly(A) polymerase